ncbi:MAG: SDR family oxidoreductase [Myxococcota bacterium]
MKIVLTGGCGFIGSHLTDALLDDGAKLLVIDNHSCAGPPYHRKEAEYLIEDIVSEKAAIKIGEFSPDVVIHLAAQMDVRYSVAHPEVDARINIEGTVNMLESARKVGCRRFIFASSGGAIYGDTEPMPAGEEHSIEPESAYGTSKRCGELYLRYFGKLYGMKNLALRLANVYGPRQSSKGEAGVVAIFAARMIEGKQAIIFGDGSQTRDYVYVTDVRNAFLTAVRRPEITGEINIGTSIETSVNRLYELMKELYGYDKPPKYAPAREGEQLRSVLLYDKATRLLDWQPSFSLTVGLQKTLDWAKVNYEQYLKS